LIDSADHQAAIQKYQKRLRQWMVDTDDHCIAAFDVREDPAKLAAAIKAYPKLVKPKAPGKKTSGDDQRKAKRKAKRGVKKTAAEAVEK